MATKPVDNNTPKNKPILGYEPGKEFVQMRWVPLAPGSSEGSWKDSDGAVRTPEYWDDVPKIPLNNWTHTAMQLADDYARAPSPTTRQVLFRHILRAGRE
jgi:hypothetical protein